MTVTWHMPIPMDENKKKNCSAEIIGVYTIRGWGRGDVFKLLIAI